MEENANKPERKRETTLTTTRGKKKKKKENGMRPNKKTKKRHPSTPFHFTSPPPQVEKRKEKMQFWGKRQGKNSGKTVGCREELNSQHVRDILSPK